MVLRCGHSFCKECLKQLIENNRNNRNYDGIKCSKCNDVDSNSLVERDISENYSLKEIIGLKKVKSVDIALPKYDCQEHPSINCDLVCVDCDRPVCFKCIIEPEHVKKGHTLEPYENHYQKYYKQRLQREIAKLKERA